MSTGAVAPSPPASTASSSRRDSAYAVESSPGSTAKATPDDGAGRVDERGTGVARPELRREHEHLVGRSSSVR